MGDLGVLGGGFAQQTFAVKLSDQGAGLLAFILDRRAGGAAFGEEDFTGLAALRRNVGIGGAAARIDAGLQLKSVPHILHFSGMGGVQRGNRIVLLLDLAVEAGRQDGCFSTALPLRQLGAELGDFGCHATEALADALPKLRSLDKLITAYGIHIGPHGGQAVHDELGGAGTTTTAVPAVVPAVAVPRAADRTADSAADECATPVSPAVIVVATVDIESGHQTFHKSLQKVLSEAKTRAPNRLLLGASMECISKKFSLLFAISSRCVQYCPALKT